MNPLEEKVQLPDPQDQFLVHPLDLPGARKEYLAGWWLGIVATPQVFTALLAALWAISNNYVTPVLVPLAVAVVSGLASSRAMRGAWDFIPRKRHDKSRPLPGLALGGAVVKSLALLGGLITFILWGAAQDFGPRFSAYPLGTGAAVVVIMAAELLVGLARRTTTDLVPRAVNLAAVTAAAWAGFQLLPAGQVPGLPDLLPGAATLLGVWIVWLLFTKWQSRRNHG